MKKNVILKKMSLLFLITLIVLAPSLRAEGSVGNYTNQSQAINVISNSNVSKEKGALLNAAVVAFAESAALAYAAGYIVGTIAHHALNGFIVNPNGNTDYAYNSNDFSNFDN